MTPDRRRAAALALLAAACGGLVLAGCGGGGDDGDATDVTLPSSLSVTTTEPGATTSSSSTTTTGVPPTSPAADGAPIIVSVSATPGPCVAGTSTATVTFEAAAEPPVRVFTVFLDAGRDAVGATNSATPIVIEGVACDGATHSALLIATGVDGRSSTQAAAFRAPRP